VCGVCVCVCVCVWCVCVSARRRVRTPRANVWMLLFEKDSQNFMKSVLCVVGRNTNVRWAVVFLHHFAMKSCKKKFTYFNVITCLSVRLSARSKSQNRKTYFFFKRNLILTVFIKICRQVSDFVQLGTLANDILRDCIFGIRAHVELMSPCADQKEIILDKSHRKNKIQIIFPKYSFAWVWEGFLLFIVVRLPSMFLRCS